MIGEKEIIVVDYKFTATQSKKHIQQVQEYVNYISTIENKNTIGFVWYVFKNVLIKVV